MRVAALLSCIVFLAACNRQKETLDRSPTPVRVTTVEAYLPSTGERYSASILPNRQTNLAFRVSGIVESIHQVKDATGRTRNVDFGDNVSSGIVLAQIRLRDYHLQVSQAAGQAQQATDAERSAQAQLAEAQAAALKAKQDYERANALFQKTSLTKSDYDAAKANYDSTRAQVQAAQDQVKAAAGSKETATAALGTANLSLHDASLTAPFAGTIVQRSIEVGALVGPSVPAFAIADISLVKATFGVPDTVIASLRKGAPISVYAEAFPTRQFRGFVSALAGVADSTTRSFQVEVTIPNEHDLLKPGMIASLDLGQPRPLGPIHVVPLGSIVPQQSDPNKFAVVTVEDNKAHYVPVTLGDTYGDLIAVSGISPGKKVIISGATLVSDGDTVQEIP